MLREILDIELNQLLISENSLPNNTIESTIRGDTPEIRPPTVANLGDASNSIEINVAKRVEHHVNAEQKAKFLYKSCMNAEILEERSLEPLYRLLKILGGWPVLDGDKWNASNFDWLELAANLRLYNNDVLINQWVAKSHFSKSYFLSLNTFLTGNLTYF